MPLLLLTLFVAVPLIEIAVFIKVGGWLGIGPTIAVVVLTAIIGTALLRRQGLAVMAEAQRALAEGRLPMDSVIDGVCLLVAGAFLLTPGLVTDTVGLLLFIPPLRRKLARWFFARLMAAADVRVSVETARRASEDGAHRQTHSPEDGPIIDAEFERLDDDNDRDDQNSGASRTQKPRGSPWRRRH